MKDNGKVIKEKDWGNFNNLMEIDIQDNGEKIKNKEKEFITILNGNTVKKKEKGTIILLTVINMRVSLKMIKEKEREFYTLIMVTIKQGSILMIELIVRLYITIKMEEFKTDNIKMVIEQIMKIDYHNNMLKI